MFVKKSQTRGVRGFTLTEAAIVLGIVGLILAAIWAAAAAVYANMRVNDAQRGITMAAQQVRSMYAVSADTGVTGGQDITSPGLFPLSWVKPGESAGQYTYVNPWQKDATSSMSKVIGEGPKFGVVLSGIDDDGCAALMGYFSQAATSTSGGSVIGLIGASVADEIPDGTFATPADCTAGVGQNIVSVGFDMKKM